VSLLATRKAKAEREGVCRAYEKNKRNRIRKLVITFGDWTRLIILGRKGGQPREKSHPVVGMLRVSENPLRLDSRLIGLDQEETD